MFHCEKGFTARAVQITAVDTFTPPAVIVILFGPTSDIKLSLNVKNTVLVTTGKLAVGGVKLAVYAAVPDIILKLEINPLNHWFHPPV